MPLFVVVILLSIAALTSCKIISAQNIAHSIFEPPQSKLANAPIRVIAETDHQLTDWHPENHANIQLSAGTNTRLPTNIDDMNIDDVPATATASPPASTLSYEIYTAEAELYCIGAPCDTPYLIGEASILINYDSNIMTIDHIDLGNGLAQDLRGSISFDFVDGDVLHGILSALILRTTNGEYKITGESAAIFTRPEHEYPGFAGFQLRDVVTGVTLDMQLHILPKP